MTQDAQFEMHPDAESLNAFVEQALGEGEQRHVMEHLAVCSRCREVVFLAKEAASEMVLEDAVPSKALVRPRGSWWRGWRIAWIPAGALALGIVTAYLVHVMHTNPAMEMARTAPQPVMRQEAGGPGSAGGPAKPTGPERAEKRAGESGGEKAAGSGSAEIRAGRRREADAMQGAPPAQPALSPPAVAVVPMTGRANQAFSMPEGFISSARAEGAEEQRKSAEPALKKQKEIAGAAGEMHGLAGGAMVSGEGKALQDASAMAQVESSPAPAAGLQATNNRAAASTFAVYSAAVAVLPSGLPAVSRALAEHAVLAVDKDGGVFVSSDAGAHWMTVAKQWDSRAVSVRTPAEPRESSAGPGSEGPGSEALFELVNDKGQVWVSQDGKSWKAR